MFYYYFRKVREKHSTLENICPKNLDDTYDRCEQETSRPMVRPENFKSH